MDNRSKLAFPLANIDDSSFSGSAIKKVNRQRVIKDGTFGPGTRIYQGDVINNAGSSSLEASAQDCRRKLFLADPAEDRKALKRKKGDRASGTCEWLLETEEFTAWLGRGQATGEAQASNILWLYGNPGTGKSTMAIFLTEELPKKSFVKDGETLIYFFCDSSFDKRKTATSILKGLLLQLIQQHSQLLDYLLHDYNNRGAELFNSFDALWTIFIAAAADRNTGQKYCIIDALDECDLESQEILLQQFQETFLSQDAPSNIRILVTSRPYSKIREYLEEFTNKNLASFSQAKQDVDRCIKERVADLSKRKKYTDKVKQQVGDILREKAEGTFLWVGLACEELKDVPSKNAIQVLQTMPKGLYSLYERLLDTALEQDKTEADIVRRILSLVAVCVRPLSVLELCEACQLYQDEEDLNTRIQFTRDQVASCRLIIIIEGGKVLLLHQSVKDYLVRAGPGSFINELEAHANIAYRCVNILIEQFYSKEQSRVYFLSYATEEWTNHARMAQSRFEVRDPEAEFFRVDSPSREHWIKTLRSDNRSELHNIPQQFSILHVAGRWGIDSLVDYIAHQNFQESNTKAMTSAIDFDCVDGRNTTPIQEAVQWGHISAVAKLLCLGAKINGLVEKVASGYSQNNKEMMAFFLDQPEHQVTITENILKAAAGDGSKEVMELLLDRRGDQITITEDVLKAAAGNWSNSKEIMELLLDRRGNLITITEGIMKVAAVSHHGKEVMELLLDRRGNQITITEDIVKAAARNDFGKKVMELLLDRRGNQITITEDIVKAAARSHNGKEVMELLLDRRGNQITITEDIVKAAARNDFGEKVMVLLLDQRKDEITITEDTLKVIAGSYHGKKAMALLLSQQGDHQITITTEVVKAAAGNYRNGKEVIKLLLNHPAGDQKTISEGITIAAVQSMSTKLFDYLRNQPGGRRIIITDELIKALVKRQRGGKEVLEFLLNQQGDCQVTATEDSVKAAAGDWINGKELIQLLLKQQGGYRITITEEVIKAAARNWSHGTKIIQLLLNQQGDQQITITEEVVNAAAGNGSNGRDILKLLLDQQQGHQITIIEEAVEAAAGNGRIAKEVMELLLKWRRDH